jgi:DNA anti-recombination protein RmuC
MLDALTPLLNTLTASRSLRPEQKADIKELQGLMQELKTQMISGKRLDNAVFAEKMSRYQALLLKVMAYSTQAAPAAPAAPPPAMPQVHLKLPQDQDGR